MQKKKILLRFQAEIKTNQTSKQTKQILEQANKSKDELNYPLIFLMYVWTIMEKQNIPQWVLVLFFFIILWLQYNDIFYMILLFLEGLTWQNCWNESRILGDS